MYEEKIEKMYEEKIEKSVTMMCGGKRCCPVLEKSENWITIKDDFGGSVKIPRKDEEALLTAVRELLQID